MSKQLKLDLLLGEDQVVLSQARFWPALAIAVEERLDGFYAAMECNLNRGGYEPFRGPYPSREAALRNAACFGRDMLHARGFAVAKLKKLFAPLNLPWPGPRWKEAA